MGQLDYGIVEEAAKQLYIKALCDLPPDVREALKKAYARESNPAARSVFEAMFKAIEIADNKKNAPVPGHGPAHLQGGHRLEIRLERRFDQKSSL